MAAAKLKSLDMLQEQLDGQLRLAQLDPLQGRQFSVWKRAGRITAFNESGNGTRD